MRGEGARARAKAGLDQEEAEVELHPASARVCKTNEAMRAKKHALHERMAALRASKAGRQE